MKKNVLLLLFLPVFLNCYSQYTNLHDFNDIDGRGPMGSLISDGTFLYGMTLGGGAYLYEGVIFKVKPDGSLFTKLHDFGGSVGGQNPYGSLVSNGTHLFGMTNKGGTWDMGTIFRIKPDGTDYQTMKSFPPYPSLDGKFPYGSLIFDGVYLYGMTSAGGSNNLGTIFRVKPNNTGFSILHNFYSADGGLPTADLVLAGTTLYGMTDFGGTADKGVVFKIQSDGTGYTKILDLTGVANGASPQSGCSLIFDGTFLYGMTTFGGSSNNGIIFKVKPDGTGFLKLLNFNGANGRMPWSSLTLIAGKLFGMADGGTGGHGVLFRINTDGSGFVKLTESNSTQYYGFGSLYSDGTFLYGMGQNSSGLGRIFKYKLPLDVNQSITICPGQSINVGASTYSITGIYTDVLTSIMNSSDSIVTTNLTVLPETNFSQSPSICSGQTFTVGSNVYDSTGAFMDVFTSLITGCDSIVTTNLTVLYSSSATTTQTLTLCAGESLTVGDDIYTSSGMYSYSFVGGGCDSTVNTNLTVFPFNSFNQEVCLVTGESVTVGSNVYSSDGIYTDILTDYHLCDSIVTTNLRMVDTSVTYISTDILQANSSGTSSSFQWIDCGTGMPLPGETYQSFYVFANGTYAVVVTEGTCSDTSTCYTFIGVGINEFDIESNIIGIYPNPFSDCTTLVFEKEYQNMTVQMFDLLGNKVNDQKFSGTKLEIFKGNLSNGVYLLRLISESGQVVQRKLVIQ